MTATRFSGTSTAAEVAQGIDLTGKVAVVTGGASGLGEETCRVLAMHGATVVLVARDASKAEAAIARISTGVPAARLEALTMELADLGSVRRAAQELLQRHPRIHLLINNAGIMACPLQRTEQGLEMQFATNHVGHFLFTCLLVPALKAAAPARVVNLSSAGHKYSPVLFDDPQFEQRAYDKWVAYGQSKTANILFSVALNARLHEAGVTANAVHPGAIITNLGRHLTSDDYQDFATQAKEGGLTYKTVEQGAATTVWAATSPQLEGKGGLYLEDCHIGEPTQGPLDGYAAYALDKQDAQRLWRLSEELVGQSFDF